MGFSADFRNGVACPKAHGMAFAARCGMTQRFREIASGRVFTRRDVAPPPKSKFRRMEGVVGFFGCRVAGTERLWLLLILPIGLLLTISLIVLVVRDFYQF